MPTNLVKSKQDEADWAEARRIVDKQYPDKSPDDKDKSYWKLTTSIYENIKKNRGKKQMQKQASVGGLLAGQIRLRKQADDNRRRGGWRSSSGRVVPLNEMTGGGRVVPLNEMNAGGHVDTWDNRGRWSGVIGRVGDKLNDWLGWNKRPKGWSNPPNRTPDPTPTRTPTPTRPPAPAPNWYPMPKWSPQPSPPPRFPIPRGIRGPWERPEYPENPPNDPLDNERIRRLVEGNKAPAPGGEWGERPINDSEIPLPDDDPGGAPAPNNRPSNTPPANPPKMTEEELNRIMRELQRGNGRPRYYDPGWNNEPGWYERMRWPRFPEVERPYNERGNNLPWWYDPNGPYYQRGVGRNGEIDPRGLYIPPDNWAPFRPIPARQIPASAYQDSQF